VKNRSYPVLTLVIVAAAAGCGGSDSVAPGGNGDPFTFDASAYKHTAGNGAAGGGGSNGLAPPGPNCGDGIVNPDEQCDGNSLGGNTCSTATMGVRPGGALACRSNCTFDLAGCTTNGSAGAGGGNGTGGGTTGTGAGPNTGTGGGP
jgi:cysteine-rich repeat protein